MAEEKTWGNEDILKLWPQAAKELRGFKKTLERKAGITASQLGMALQLAEAEFQRVLSASGGGAARAYQPAKSREPIRLGRTDCPLVVLRSHPDFPNTLSPELEGAWTGTNPEQPKETIEGILKRLSPVCHTEWADLDREHIEERNGLRAFVVYVRPGPEPVAVGK